MSGSKGKQTESSNERSFYMDEYLMDSYQRSVDIMIESISKTGDKAVKIARLDGLLLGLLLTGLSLLLTAESITIYPQSISVWIMIGSGISAIFLSLIFSIVSYSEQTYYYGPKPSLVRELRKHHQEEVETKRLLYDAYEDALEGNESTLSERAQYIQYSLSFLLFGLLSVSFGVLLLVTNFHPLLRGGLVASAGIAIGGLALYFHRKTQLPIIGSEKEHLSDE